MVRRRHLVSDALRCTVRVKWASELGSSIRAARKRNSKDSGDLRERVGDGLGVKALEEVYLDVSAISVCCDVGLLAHVKQVDGNHFHRKGGLCGDQRFCGFAQPELLALLSFVDQCANVVFHRRPIV